jgi:putative acetyltransferase
MLTITAENPRRPDVLVLLGESDEYSKARYPAESCHLVDPAALAQQNVRFLVARRGERAVGCGALVLAEDGSAELKRMIITASARGQGLGRMILARLEHVARDEHVQVVRLETGVHNDAALRIYRASGYRNRGPFGSYRPDPLSVFMEKVLSP